MTTTATILRGPADADHFRVKVGRFGDRFYDDPLPACPLADADNRSWPSVTTIKKASGQDWSFVAIKRVAHGLAANPRRIDGLDAGGVHDTLKSIDRSGSDEAKQRGTDLHGVAESKLRGQPGVLLPHSPGVRWMPALDAFFDAYQPTLVAAEVVAINRELNGYGYGGTFDAVVEIDGALYLVDWKTRGEDSAHGAYPEEAAQIAAYATADYIIVDDGQGGAVRQRMPELAGGLIVSIKPDGYQAFPVDLTKAAGHWCSLHAWWVARRSEREPIGKPWAPKGAPQDRGAGASAQPIETGSRSAFEAVPAPDRPMVVERVRALVAAGHAERLALRWPAGVPGLAESDAHTGEQLAEILAVVRRLEDETSAPWHPADSAPAVAEPAPVPAFVQPDSVTPPDEGDRVDAELVGKIAERLALLPPAMAAQLGAIAREANAAHRSISLQQLPSVRRFEIVRALLALAQHCCPAGELDEDSVRGLLALVMDDAAAEWPTQPLGAVIGALTIDEARRLAELAPLIGTEHLAMTVHPDGRCEFTPTAP